MITFLERKFAGSQMESKGFYGGRRYGRRARKAVVGKMARRDK